MFCVIKKVEYYGFFEFFQKIKFSKNCMDTNNPIKKKKSRHKFTKEEDQKLLNLVNQYGKNCWSFVAQNMDGLTARQCRERYQDYLSPGIRNEVWTFEEDQLLQQKVAEYGQRWTTIAKFFNSRTDVNIKNHWTILSQRLAKSRKLESDKERLLNSLDPNFIKQYTDQSFGKLNKFYQKQVPPGVVVPQLVPQMTKLVPAVPIHPQTQSITQIPPSNCSLSISNVPGPSLSGPPVLINSIVTTVHSGQSISPAQPPQSSQPLSPLPPFTSNFSQTIQCPVMMINNNNVNRIDNLNLNNNNVNRIDNLNLNNNNVNRITIGSSNENTSRFIQPMDFSQHQTFNLPPLLQQPKEKQLASPISLFSGLSIGGIGNQVDIGIVSPSSADIIASSSNNICATASSNNSNANQDVDKDIFEPVPGSIDAIEIETRPYDIKSVE